MSMLCPTHVNVMSNTSWNLIFIKVSSNKYLKLYLQICVRLYKYQFWKITTNNNTLKNQTLNICWLYGHNMDNKVDVNIMRNKSNTHFKALLWDFFSSKNILSYHFSLFVLFIHTVCFVTARLKKLLQNITLTNSLATWTKIDKI